MVKNNFYIHKIFKTLLICFSKKKKNYSMIYLYLTRYFFYYILCMSLLTSSLLSYITHLKLKGHGKYTSSFSFNTAPKTFFFTNMGKIENST